MTGQLFDAEFDAEGTLERLAQLLTKGTDGTRMAEELAFMHMAAHGVVLPLDAEMQCKRQPCKLAGISFAHSEIREWKDWTTREKPRLQLDQEARDLAKAVISHPFLPELRKYLHQNYSRFHPSKTESKHIMAAAHDATCVAPARILHSTATLVRNIESFLETLQVPPTVVNRTAGEPGRPKQVLFHAVAQHLFAGGHSYAYVAKLLGCSVERARGAIRSTDARWFVSEGGTRPLPTS
jgi:hypothetical protein